MPINLYISDTQEISDLVLTNLTDQVEEVLYPGDERRIFSDALVFVFSMLFTNLNDQARQRFLRYARGEVLDAIAWMKGLERLPATPASDMIKFTLVGEQTRNVLIPAGTRVTPDGLVFFATTANLTIAAGSTTGTVTAECQEVGEDYNGMEAGTITTLVDPIEFVDSVTNLYGTEGGDNGEQDDEEGNDHFRERIRLADSVEGASGTEDSIISKVLGADTSIIDASVVSPQPYKIVIYPLLENGAIPDSDMLAKVAAVFNRPDKKTRLMTDVVTASAPEQVSYDIKLKYYVTPENEAAAVNLVETDGGMIDAYKTWQCEKLGRDINPDALRRELLQNTDELGILVERVDITAPVYTEIPVNKVAKFSGTLQVSHEVVTTS